MLFEGVMFGEDDVLCSYINLSNRQSQAMHDKVGNYPVAALPSN